MGSAWVVAWWLVAGRVVGARWGNMAEHHPPQTFDPSLEAPMEVTTIERIELGPNFPKISPCDEALHNSYRGISAAKFAQWRHKFDEKVAMHPSRKLKTRLELARIYNLLDDWDNMTHAHSVH